MKSKGAKPAEFTRGLSEYSKLLISALFIVYLFAVKEKLNEDADSEIATTMLRVSLICPLGKMRMTTPCRASTCMHLQCFDASLYLQMNERKPTWNCPVCDRSALYENLVIDGYFQDVIASQKLGADDNEIQLMPDGSWSTLANKTELCNLETPKKGVQKVEVISDDLGKEDIETYFYKCCFHLVFPTEMITEDFPKSTLKALIQSNTSTTGKPSADTVDLTIDSDEEDEPIKAKGLAKAKNGT